MAWIFGKWSGFLVVFFRRWGFGGPKKDYVIHVPPHAWQAKYKIYTVFLGASSTWPYAFLVLALLQFPMLPVSCLLPDSPVWFASKKRMSEMRKSIVYFHGTEDMVDQIIEDATAVMDTNISSKQKKTKCDWWQEYLQLFTLKPLRKPVLISLAILCSGSLVRFVLNYISTTLLIGSGFRYSVSTYFAVSMKLAGIICFLICLFTIDILGRRILLLIGCFGSFLSWSLMGIFQSLIPGKSWEFCIKGTGRYVLTCLSDNVL